MYIRSFGSQYKYLGSKLLAPVVCFAELLETALNCFNVPFGQSNIHGTLNFCLKISQEGIKYTKAK